MKGAAAMNDRNLKFQKNGPISISHMMVLSGLMVALLNGCSTTSETFDCKEGKGVGCKSIVQVNKMIDEGLLSNEMSEGISSSVHAMPVITTASLARDKAIPALGENGEMVVHRVSEEYLRVWMAPFQDAYGDLHEGTVVHTILKPGFWHIKGGE